MNETEALRPQFERIQQRAFQVGGIALLILLVGALVSTQKSLQSYLYGYVLLLGLSFGSLGVLLLHHLVSGHWGNVIQRIVESGAKMTALMALLFIPVLAGMQLLYPWTRPEVVEASHVLHHKEGYLNVPFFLVRTVVYFGFWIGAAFWLSKWSLTQDKTADPAITRKMKIFSGPAMVAFVLVVTFASVDWVMSLEPEWFSTIYGMMLIVGGTLTTLAFCIIVIGMLADRPPLADVLTTRHYHHLGNLLFAFTILWAYIAFSQFLIIWSGNLPEDNMWYIKRLGDGWNITAALLLVGHFFVPFFVLLSRRRKRVIGNLVKVAAFVLVMRLVDVFWLVMPAFSGKEFEFHWTIPFGPIAIGGLWLGAFMWDFKKHPILPLNDPRFSGENGHH
jgi:hypothetical protein